MLLKLFVITKWYAQQNTIILCKCKLATGRKPPPATPESRYVTVRTVSGVDFGVVSADASRSHSIRSPCWMRLIHIICTLMRRKWGSRRHIVVCDACIVFCSIYREWNWLPFRLLFMRPKTVNGTQRPNRATSVWGVKGFVESLWTVNISFAESQARFSLFHSMSTATLECAPNSCGLRVDAISHINWLQLAEFIR